MAIDCGANILPADTPTEFAATIHSGDAPMFIAAVFWMVPNRAPVLVPEPVTNAPMAPMSGATKGKYCPRVSTKNSAMVFVMPE